MTKLAVFQGFALGLAMASTLCLAVTAASAAGKADLVNSIGDFGPSTPRVGPTPSTGPGPQGGGNGGSGANNGGAGAGGGLIPVMACVAGLGCRIFFIPYY